MTTKSPENQTLREKWRKLGYDKVTDYLRDHPSELAHEQWSGMIYRDRKLHDKSLMIMAFDLGFTNNEIAKMLETRGEAALARLVRSVDLDEDEKQIVQKIRKIKDPAKLKLVENLIDQLGG